MSGPSEMATRWHSQARPSGTEYDARWDELAAAGGHPHGEADFVMALDPRTVLDAGCGTGRVAIELARRGVETVGVDLDADFVERARAKDPQIDWRLGDLATIDLGVRFDVVLAAGNVMIFLTPNTEGAVLTNLAQHCAPGGRVVVGFQIRADRLPLDEFDDLASAAGLMVVERFATWERDAFRAGDYAVSVLVPARG